MQKELLPLAEQYAKQNKRQSLWRRIVRVMACAVVFCTTYALILPAITMERPLCDLEEHAHSESCYVKLTPRQATSLACSYDTLGVHEHEAACCDAEGTLICGYADFLVHTHSTACYDENGMLVCPMPVIKEHEHTDECYQAAEQEEHIHDETCYTVELGELICGLEETEGHIHSAECMARGDLICGLEETEGHTHGEGCSETVLVCELTVEPHAHTDGCYTQLVCDLPEDETHTHSEECSGLVLNCDLTEQAHVHSEGCYQTNSLCDLPETAGHTHGDSCYASVLDCGMEESEGHTHEASCYEQVEHLICEPEETEAAEPELICEEAVIKLHTHDEDDCYETYLDENGEEQKRLICEETVVEEHIHSESCFVTEEVPLEDVDTLTCTLAEGHVHGEGCYDESGTLICAETENHTHGEMCYGTWVLSCGLEEHTHTEGCAAETEAVTWYCGLEEHTHTEECLDTEGNLVCDLTEHVHDEECTVEPVAVTWYCGYEEHTHTEECTDDEGNLVCDLAEHTHVEDCSVWTSVETEWIDRTVAATPTAASLIKYSSNTTTDNSAVAKFMLRSVSTTSIQQDPWEDLNLDKYVIDNEDGTFTLRLETYVTGSDGSLLSTPVPTDIVLVLDESGSMNDCIACGHEIALAKNNNDCTKLPDKIEDGYTITAAKVYADAVDTSRYYQIVYKDDTTRIIDYCEKCQAWYSSNSSHFGSNATHTGWGKWTPFTQNGETPKYDQGVEYYVQFYCYCDDHEKTRNEVLTSVATNFIEEVYADAAGEDGVYFNEDDVKHRVAIVGYDNNDYPRFYSIDGSAVQGTEDNADSTLRDVRYSDEKNILLTGLNTIRTKGATATNQGMYGAEMILRNNPLETGELRNRVVILFTDGSPGSSYVNSPEWANGAISYAYTIKNTHEATVYCVGLYPGADGNNPESLPEYDEDENGVTNPQFFANGNRFLHLVSSNYLYATSLDDTGSVTDLASGQSYYLSTEDEEGLYNIFGQLADVVTPGQTSITALDEKAVVRDIVTDYFTITDPSLVTAWSESYIGLAEDGVTKLFQRQEDDVSLTPVVSGNTVDVSGFDYSENFVHMEVDTDGNDVPMGKRVVVEIPIVPAEDNSGGYKQPTNVTGKTGTAVYYEGTYLKSYPLPYVDVPTTVSIQKLITGNVSDPMLKFDFTVEYTKLSSYEDVELSTYGDSNYLQTIETVKTESFELGHEDIVVLNDVCIGSTLTVTETTMPGYTVKVSVDGEEFYPGVDGTIEVTVGPDMQIIYTNDAGYELPNTGGAGTYQYTMGGLLIMLMAAISLYIHSKKKRKEERPSF